MNRDQNTPSETYKVVSFGMVLATAISFTVHQSILWAMVHGILGWGYVLYYAVTR